MALIDRYLARHVAIGIAAAAALLVPLLSFLDLLEELDDVGEHGYSLLLALEVVVMTIPRRAVDMGPFAALLGGIAGLGHLAASGELTALRAAGVSVARIAATTLGTGVLLALALAATEELAAAPLQQKAWELRARAMSGPEATGEGGVVWARRGGQLLRVGDLRIGRIPLDVEIFQLDGDNRLLRYMHAARAEVGRDGTWQLHDVQIKRWDGAREAREHRAQVAWPSILATAQLGQWTLPIGHLSPRQLHERVRFLEASGEPASAYALALWQKLGSPVLTLAMVLLAVPFAFGPTRSTGQGMRLALGALVGLLVYLLDQIVLNLGLVFGLSAPAVGLLPPLAALVAALALVRRLH